MPFYDAAAEYFARHLERAIEAHEAGRTDEISVGFGDAPDWTADEERDYEGALRLGAAYSFWDRWIDARNHDWGYYPGAEAEDWPTIARQIVRGLREKWTPEQMMDNAAFAEPPAPPRVSLWARIVRAFG